MSLLRLAEDEARMLGRGSVEPEHVLLALARRGFGEELFSENGANGADLFDAIIRVFGLGDELVLGRLRRSLSTQSVLENAVVAAAQRGQARPEEADMLLALGADERAGQVLHEAGIANLAHLVRRARPVGAAPLDDAVVRRELVRAAMNEDRRPSQAPVPVFERFTGPARRAVSAAAETAAQLEHREVMPFHLLIGCLQVGDSFAGGVLSELWAGGELGVIGEAVELAKRVGPSPFHESIGTFTAESRRVVAEDALKIAYRLGHDTISTGHLMLAILDAHDRTTERMTWPHSERLARALMHGLPGGEESPGERDFDWLRLDLLMRTLVKDFRRVVPPGWTVRGSARTDIHLRTPESKSESDFEIRPGWIIAEPGNASERLRRVTLWMLERLQAAVGEATGRPWPTRGDSRSAAAYAELTPQRYNTPLQLGYGDPQAPVLRVTEPDILVHMMISSV